MAGTSTVPQFANGIIYPRFLHLLVLLHLEVIRVASRTKWLISDVGPGHDLAVTLVTIYAPHAGRVVAWIVARRMAVGEERCPVVGPVAFIALQ